MKPLFSPLNYRELETLVAEIKAELWPPKGVPTGGSPVYFDRVVIPARPRFPDGFIKGEFALRLTSKKQELTLLVSLRPRHPYIALIADKGPRAAETGTHSPFSQFLLKSVRGSRILGLTTVPRERMVLIEFDDLVLSLSLHPATPMAQIYEKKSLKVLASTRAPGRTDLGVFGMPNGVGAPESPPMREGLASRDWTRELEKSLASEALELRRERAKKQADALLKTSRDRVRQSGTALREAEKESDWRRYGDLLKASIHLNPVLRPDHKRVVTDFETGSDIEIPCDPKLSLSDQVERFYHHARRKQRRMSEARSRVDEFSGKAREIETALANLTELDWPELERLEKRLGLGPAATTAPSSRHVATTPGKKFRSRDGLTLLVGREKNENLELTFKIARGNDLWMHVRGRPGSHVVIPLSPGKSAPLETLLDAATLCLFYSGGEKWGKTEVDYTYKKYVKRIKDSTEASYTHNKTLVIQIEPDRLKRLLAAESEALG